jgi:hypothetical protein
MEFQSTAMRAVTEPYIFIRINFSIARKLYSPDPYFSLLARCGGQSRTVAAALHYLTAGVPLPMFAPDLRGPIPLI